MNNWTEELLPEYRKYRRELSRHLRGLDVNMPEYVNDKTQLSSMIRSMTNDIQWMETGNDPMYQGGVHIESAYNRKNIDMDLIPDLQEHLKEGVSEKSLYLAPEEKMLLRKIFQTFSDRESECYILYEGHKLSMNEIAIKLGLSKRTVQQYVERARAKVEEVVGVTERKEGIV